MAEIAKKWIPISLTASSLGNFLVGLSVAHEAKNIAEFASFAVTFTFYTIILSFFRPIISDSLINKDLFKKSNGREYVRDAFLFSVLLTIFSICLYLCVPQLRSNLMIILFISLPALLMHDAFRFKMLSFQLNRSLAVMDAFWTISFLVMTIGLFLVHKQNPASIFLAWTLPTLLTTVFGVAIIYKQEPGAWKSSWIITSKPIWTKIFREFILGPGLIQIIFLISISIFDSSSIANLRLSITLLFPLTLLTSTQVLEIFNFSKWSPLEANPVLVTRHKSRQRKITFALMAAYLAVIFAFYGEIINIIADFQFDFDFVTLLLLSVSILLTMMQIDEINILKKNNHYSELIKIRFQLLPLILTLSLTLGIAFSLNGVLCSLNVYSVTTLFLIRSFRTEANREHSILIVTEENSGGAFLAAKDHFESSSRAGTLTYFAFPGFPNLADMSSQFGSMKTAHIFSQNFPANIGNFRSSIAFMREFRKLWNSLNKPNLFAHGIRSGFLISICSLRRPVVLIHRHLDLNLPLSTRLLLRFQRIFFQSTHSVAPVSQAFKSVNFFPILSPKLNTFVSKPRTQQMDGSVPLRIIWVSRLDFPKNPEALLKALSHLDPNVYTCTMIGDGPKAAQCKATSKFLRLNVTFDSGLNAMQELQKSDVLVLLSQFEGVPFILQEALACGVVVICSKLPGNEFLGGTSFDYVETHDELLTSLLSFMKREHLAMRQKMVRDRWVFIRPKLHSTWDITGSAISDDEQKQT